MITIIYFVFALNIIILVTLIYLIGYLLLRLTNWWKKYTQWKKDLVFDLEDNLDELNAREMNSSALPNVEVWTLEDEKKSVHDLITDKTLLVFLDSSCIYCNTNFESLFYLIAQNKKINLLIFFKLEDKEDAQLFLELYNNSFDIFLIDKSIFSTLNLTFFPAYVRLDESFTIKQATPIPLQAINSI